MNRIEIPYILWKKQSVGVALHKMVDGDNEILCTACGKDGKPYFTEPIIINKQEAIEKYGTDIVNKPNLTGVWIPIEEFKKCTLK